MRMSGQPFLVVLKPQDPAKRKSQADFEQLWGGSGLERLPLNKKAQFNGQEIDEYWLQNILAQAPDLLPVSTVDERVLPPLLSLGMEIPTLAGPIDNLFLSKNGHLVVVETKLWRNPDARRKVVAQILDYATHLRSWNYSKLEKLWAGNRRQPEEPVEAPRSLWEAVRPADAEEKEWIDLVNDNLSKGRMTLLVVGDGIQSQIEHLAEIVSGQPGFLFRLALIELQLYQLNEGQILVLPSTIARTKEIERAVVRVIYTQEVAPTVSVDVDVPKPPGPSGVLSEEDYLTALRSKGPDGQKSATVAEHIIELLKNTDLKLNWTPAGFTIKLLDPRGLGGMLWLGGATANPPILYFFTTGLEKTLSSWGWSKESIRKIIDSQNHFLDGFGRTPSGRDQRNVDLPTLEGKEKLFMEEFLRVPQLIQEEAKLQTASHEE